MAPVLPYRPRGRFVKSRTASSITSACRLGTDSISSAATFLVKSEPQERLPNEELTTRSGTHTRASAAPVTVKSESPWPFAQEAPARRSSGHAGAAGAACRRNVPLPANYLLVPQDVSYHLRLCAATVCLFLVLAFLVQASESDEKPVLSDYNLVPLSEAGRPSGDAESNSAIPGPSNLQPTMRHDVARSLPIENRRIKHKALKTEKLDSEDPEYFPDTPDWAEIGFTVQRKRFPATVQGHKARSATNEPTVSA